MLHNMHLKTNKKEEMLDITAQVQEFLRQENVREGIVIIFSAHTTAGITINENADPDVQKDFLRRLDKIYPQHDPEDQHYEGNSAAHLKSSTVGSSQTVIVQNGRLLLGRWQGIYFCEFDGPRERTFLVKILPG